jgi:hypothetical protein
MKFRPRQWLAALLLLPIFAGAEEPVVADPQAVVPAQRTPAAPSFDLKQESMQGILRAAAATQDQNDAAEISSDTLPSDTPASDASLALRLGTLEFRAPRRPHHTECDSFDCVAYTADGLALYSFPRDQMIHPTGGDYYDTWLACQSGDDMLSTFERYDQCRGVDIGLPPKSLNGVQLKLPKIRLGD